MRPPSSAPSDKKPVDWGQYWGQYARDARDLFLATSSATPAAMWMWTLAWRDWLTSVATTQDALVRKWASIVQDPSSGAAMLDQMRQDVKQYVVDVAGIPEQSMLRFLDRMSESVGNPGGASPTPDEAFVHAADAVFAAAADAFSQFETTNEARAAQGSGGRWAAALPDPLAALRERMAHLSDATMRLRRHSAEST
jgi:hypothetical protein